MTETTFTNDEFDDGERKRIGSTPAELAGQDGQDVAYNNIHDAARMGGTGDIAVLIRYGANPNELEDLGENYFDAQSHTPVYLAAANGHADTLKSLLNLGGDAGDQGDSPLIGAIQENRPETVGILLDHGADIDQFYVDVNGQPDRTPLMESIDWGRGEIAKELIARGAYVNAQNEEGNTALHYAGRNNAEETTKELLAAGADTTLVNRKGETAEDAARGEAKKVLVAHREQQVLRQAAGVDENEEPAQRSRRM